jgi:hypothetical protein
MNLPSAILDRRDFFKTSAVAGSLLAAAGSATSAPLTEKDKLARIASNTWPLRYLFKSRMGFGSGAKSEEMKKKYGEITLLDFPQFTKNTFPGVTHMDLFSGLFGDPADDSMYVEVPLLTGVATRTSYEFDPSSAAGKRWLDKLAARISSAGTHCQHISNNAPRDICDLDAAKRRTGIEIAKKWIDGAKILGAKSMRVNSGGPRIAPSASVTTDYPKNDELAKYLGKCWLLFNG